MNCFQGRKLWIVTKHGKEKVLAPILERELGVITERALHDTDLLGTFTGEVERQHDPVTTLRNKCRLAFENPEVDLVLASEGSFGMHPYYYFFPADEEWLMLYDKRNNLEIVVKNLTTETNFKGRYINDIKELYQFQQETGFPTHALIVRNAENGMDFIQKGITDSDRLFEYFSQAKSGFGKAFLETDMRAFFNPTRMNVIKDTGEKLIQKIKSTCPNCATPGFGIVRSAPGLSCNSCGLPTQSILFDLYQCAKCGFEEKKYFPFDKEEEDPQFCQFCNP